MDPERAKRRQSLKIIVSETIMVIAVVLMVAILALLVSGYWVNSDFKVERQGLLQVSSMPTGADVYIDGDSSWFQRTNTSKVLSSGEHTITITKEGYDSWSRTINISEGLLYRLHYPRLFLNERITENVLNATADMATFSPDHSSLLLINNTTMWQIVNVDSDNLTPQSLDISNIFSSISIAEGAAEGLFTGEILEAKWDKDGNHVLFKVKSESGTEWVLLDIKNPTKSTNLTKDFGSDFSAVQILDNSANNLLVIRNGNLHKIDLGSRVISAILVENVIDFDHYEANEAVFSATDKVSSQDKYYVGVLKLSNGQITKAFNTVSPSMVVINKFYDDKYITSVENNVVSLYKKDDFSLVQSFNLSFSPESLKVGHDGEFITMVSGNKIATLDMEAMATTEWQVENSNFGWLDNDMVYTVLEGQLAVYDFNGLNRRVLSTNAADGFPAAITSDKWLYYFFNNHLVRELITR